MKNIALAMLLGSSALVAAPAFAQSSDAPAAPAATTEMPSASTSSGNFVTKREANQYLASSIRGATVMGPQNESIGKVSDMVVGDDGRLAAVTVDVGGFLGIGAKTVALPASDLKYVPVAATANADMANNNAMAPAGTAAPAGGAASDPATTGSTIADNSAAGGAMPSASATAAASGDGSKLDHIMVNFTRDQLQNAPEFAE